MKKKDRSDEGMTLAYTDKSGNKFYTLISPANLHATRGLVAWTFSKDSEYSLSRYKLKQAFDKMNEAVNKKDIATLAKLVGILEAALDLYAEPEILLNLATCYTFLNDEKNEGYKDFIQDKKREIWANDSECKSFFLQFAFQYTQRYSESLKLNVRNYLEKAKPILDQLNLYLPNKK